MNNLSIRSIFSAAWSDFKKHWIVLISLTMGSMLFGMVHGYINLRGLNLVEMEALLDSFGLTWIPAWYASPIILFLALTFGMIYAVNLLDIAFGRKLSWFTVDFFVLAKVMVFYLLIGLPFILLGSVMTMIQWPENMALVAVIALTSVIIYIASYYFVIRSMLAALILLEEKSSTVIDAFYTSWNLTQDHVLFIIKMVCVQVLILCVGILFCGIGLLVTMPITMLMGIHLFKALLQIERSKA